MTQSESNQKHSHGTEPVAGSTLYYSLLHCDEHSRQRALNTLKLVNTLSTTLYDVNEPQVAEKKIHWWHEELSRLHTREARHPDCIAVQSHLHDQASLSACLTILSAAASERYNPLSTEQALREHILNDYRARVTLFERALKSTTPKDDTPKGGVQHHDVKGRDAQSNDSQSNSATEAQAIKTQPITFQPSNGNSNAAGATENLSEHDAIALGLGYCHRLNSLAARIHNGYSAFSDELYQHFDLTPENLLSQSDSRPLLDHAIAQANDALSNSIAMASTNKKRSSVPLSLLIMVHIRQAQMRLWQKKQPDLIREIVTLTPIKKFFIAYRCKRRYK